MRLYGRIMKDSRIIREALAENKDEKASFRDALEECLVGLCRELDIPVPLWLKKNTTEFSSFRRTFFSHEQFLEEIKFDRFEIRIE